MSLPQASTTTLSSDNSKGSTATIIKRGTPTMKWYKDYWKAISAEVASTGLMVLFGCMSCLPFDNEPRPLILPVFGFGLAVMINVVIFGHISECHMNPAVTITSMLLGRKSLPVGILYMIAQCVGAIAGYGVLEAMTSIPSEPHGFCTNVVNSNISILNGVIVEGFLTGALALLCCGVWDARNSHLHDSVPIKFGLAITALATAGASLTGPSLNPARSLGPAVWNNYWENHWVFWVGPILGAVISTLIYKFVWSHKEESATTEEPLPTDVERF